MSPHCPRPRSPRFRRVLPAGRVGVVILGLVAGAAESGCRGCDDDTPYTPFGVQSSIPTPDPATNMPAASASGQAEPRQFDPQRSMEAPRGATSWQLGGSVLHAPAGFAFIRGLTADFNGDETPESVALLAPLEGVGAQLWVFPARGNATRVWTAPGHVPFAPECRFDASLAQTGRRSVTVEISANCPDPLPGRAPTRSVAVIAPLAADPVILALRAAAPAPGERLDLNVQSLDRDEDGGDDVELEVVVAREDTQPAATARLAWLDRTAGPAPSPGEPRTSLEALARSVVDRAKTRKSARLALDGVANARRLIASLCAESATPRVFDGQGNPLPCGDLQNVTDQLATAEVQAWLSQDDVLSAIGVLTRDGWYQTQLSLPVRQNLTQAIESRTRAVQPDAVSHLLATVPRREPHAIRWSSLAFEQPEPTLLVRTPAGLMRASADGLHERPANPSSGARAWPLEVQAGSTGTWGDIEQSCEQSELVATFSTGAERPRALPEVLAARPGACDGVSVPPVPPPIPLGPTTNGLEAAIIAGARVGADPGRYRPGLPRSPDGNRFAVPTTLGVLVLGGDKPELWSAPELSPTHAISDCVVANAASAIACVKDTRVILARR